MKLCALLLLAALSLSSMVAPASTRPRYGGTLRLALREAPVSLDPAQGGQSALQASPGQGISSFVFEMLMFDTLVRLDARGQAQPWLASSWRADPGNQRWRFSIRRGVTFQDGTAVSPDAVAAALRTANPNWKVFTTAEEVVIECETPAADLPAILALPRNGIAKRSGGKLSGSGPFAVSRWDPGKKLVLMARDDYWNGRAFVDSIEIDLGKNLREQIIGLDLSRTDIVQVAPDQARRARLEGRRVEASSPAELLALVFRRDSLSPDEAKLRQALSLSLDREAMNNVLLQGGGEPTGGLLPDWMTGYAFLFPSAVDLLRARQTLAEVHTSPTWSLGYDASDPLARVLAERIALNARDAGITLQPSNSGSDLQLVRLPLPSLDGRVALSELAAALGLPGPRFDGDPAYSLYAAESALLQSQRVIPLLHLRSAAAISGDVMGWQEDPDGGWRLADLWLETEKP